MKMKREGVKREAVSRRVRVLLVVLFTLHVSSFTMPEARATPSQAEVFKSIQENVGQQSDDSGKALAWLAAGAGALIMVLLVGSKLRLRRQTPQGLHHPGKLLREVMKTVPLKPKELKQLKMLAESAGGEDGDGAVESPLTLLLCPSVLARTLKTRPAKIDRAVMAQIIRKMGVTAAK